MAEFQLIINNNSDLDLVAAANDSKLDGLVSDQVVTEWLRGLEREASAIESRQYVDMPRRLYA